MKSKIALKTQPAKAAKAYNRNTADDDNQLQRKKCGASPSTPTQPRHTHTSHSHHVNRDGLETGATGRPLHGGGGRRLRYRAPHLPQEVTELRVWW